MRGKKAKAMRRIIKHVFNHLPEVKYDTQTLTKQYLVNDASSSVGFRVEQYDIDILTLARDCKRWQYKFLKNSVKKRDRL